jgi:hypothetical protein
MPISAATSASTKTSETGAVFTAESSKNVRSQFNAAIVQASLDVSISSKNEPLALLFRSAIDSLNEMLKPDLGANAIQNAASQDNTPEGTASRIVSLSTNFFDSYKLQHPDEDAATQLQNFMDTIRTGFEKGYQEATNILRGLQVFDGDIAASIEKTHELVLQGYADFEKVQSAQITGTE